MSSAKSMIMVSALKLNRASLLGVKRGVPSLWTQEEFEFIIAASKVYGADIDLDWFLDKGVLTQTEYDHINDLITNNYQGLVHYIDDHCIMDVFNG